MTVMITQSRWFVLTELVTTDFLKSFNFTLFLYRSMAIQLIKTTPANAGDTRDVGSIPGSGRSPRVGNGNPFQYSCLKNPMEREAWQSRVHGLTKNCIRLSTHTLLCA